MNIKVILDNTNEDAFKQELKDVLFKVGDKIGEKLELTSEPTPEKLQKLTYCTEFAFGYIGHAVFVKYDELLDKCLDDQAAKKKLEMLGVVPEKSESVTYTDSDSATWYGMGGPEFTLRVTLTVKPENLNIFEVEIGLTFPKKNEE